MEILIIIAGCELLALAVTAVWVVYLQHREKELTRLANETRQMLERTMEIRDAERMKPYYASYTLTDSDYNKPYEKLRETARRRMGEYIGRQIAHDYDFEVVHDGTREIEYRYCIEARKK